MAIADNILIAGNLTGTGVVIAAARIGANDIETIQRKRRFTAGAGSAGQPLTMKYAAGGGGTATFLDRDLYLDPVSIG